MDTYFVEIMKDWEKLELKVVNRDYYTLEVEGQAGHWCLDLFQCTLRFTGDRDKIELDLIKVPIEYIVPAGFRDTK